MGKRKHRVTAEEPVTDGEVGAAGAVIARDVDGSAFFRPVAPRAVRELRGARADLFADLQEMEHHLEQIRAEQDRCVEDLRAGGVSWAVIGFGIGISGEAARQRWGIPG